MKKLNPAICPKCGNEKIDYDENIVVTRRVTGVTEEGLFVLSEKRSVIKVPFTGHLVCRKCQHERKVPFIDVATGPVEGIETA